MNITIYAVNNWLLYFIYLHNGFISVITIIAVQLYCVRSINRIPRQCYTSNWSKPIEVGLRVGASGGRPPLSVGGSSSAPGQMQVRCFVMDCDSNLIAEIISALVSTNDAAYKTIADNYNDMLPLLVESQSV